MKWKLCTSMFLSLQTIQRQRGTDEGTSGPAGGRTVFFCEYKTPHLPFSVLKPTLIQCEIHGLIYLCPFSDALQNSGQGTQRGDWWKEPAGTRSSQKGAGFVWWKVRNWILLMLSTFIHSSIPVLIIYHLCVYVMFFSCLICPDLLNNINLSYLGQRDSLSAQLDLTVTKAESEQLARALQEEQYFELSQENKKAMTRHKQEIVEREGTITRVSKTWSSLSSLSTMTTIFCSLRSDEILTHFHVSAQLEESNKTLTKDVEHLSKEKADLDDKLSTQEEGTFPLIPRTHTENALFYNLLFLNFFT